MATENQTAGEVAKRGRAQLRKLTLRSFGSIKETRQYAESGKGAEVPLGMVAGMVTDAKPGESDNGPFIKLFGAFQARNLQTGEITDEIGCCILPNYIVAPMVAAMKQGGFNIQFKVQFNVKEDPRAAVGYQYEARNLMPVQRSNVLAELWGDDLPLLEAPASSPAALVGNDGGAAAAPAPTAKKAPAPAPAAKKPAGKKR